MEPPLADHSDPSTISVDVTSSSPPTVGRLDHHVFDANLQTWIKQPPQAQPFLKLDLSIHPSDYDDLKLPRMISTLKSASVRVMADTGCQASLISFKILKQLGVYEHHLIPVSMRMNTPICGAIEIIGCVVMRLSGTDSNGRVLETRQIVYVTNTSNKIFLCRKACADLGLISQSFPLVGEAAEIQVDSTSAPQCHCLKRTPAPPKPTKLPFAATKENRGRIEKYLLDYYAASAFNTCTHQPMPMMKTTPMRLMIKENAVPVARHKPIPIPLHWQDEVKEALDADVRKGNIEPVPIGEPVTWCHQMIIAEKKDGTPRRTIDLQPLNAYAIRETHHT